MSFDNLLSFIGLGFAHILPLGLDHILFIIAIYLTASSWRSLLLQVTAFTVAHTVTLGLAAADLVSAPAEIVEPVIALSIAAVGLEAIFVRGPRPWRLPIIFLFGLFHGLGFASQMKGFMERADFVTALIGFNLGVELGQLTVLAVFGGVAIAIAAGLRRAGRIELYPWVVVRPVAAVIALSGAWWFLQRTGLIGAA